MDEGYASGQVQRELARIRKNAPDEETTRRHWSTANSNYKNHVIYGWGDRTNGAAIRSYYIERQAYFLYAQERGFSLEVE